MKLKLIIGLLVLLVLLIGCESSTTDGVTKLSFPESQDLKVYTLCEDNVVCYYHDGVYSGGMGCFRDEDLVTKYCGGT